MDGQAQIGRVSGIPIFVDYGFILLVLLWGHGYFTAGSPAVFMMGLWVVGGLALSIIVHELAHAFAGRWYGIRTSGIEVNCCGGLCHLEKAAPNPKADIVILLAGPASNLALWAVFSGLAYGIYELPDQFWRFEGLHWFGAVATTLASVNFAMFWFNLLPSHPLDGGRAMAAMMQGRLGRERAMRIIAWSGMAVCGCLALASAGAGMFTLFIAYHLYMHNQQVLDTHHGPRLERWDK